MRLLHLVHAFQTGGAEQVVLNLIEHGSADIENFVCSFTQPNELAGRLSGSATQFRCLNKRPGNDPAVVPRLARIISELGIDLVHAQGWGTYLEGLLAAKLFAKRRAAFVFAFHGKTLEEARRGMPLRRRLAQRAARWLTDAYVAPAAHMAEEYARGVGIQPGCVHVIPNGIDTSRFRFGRDDALRNTLGLHAESFVVGFVGRLDPVKNVRGMLQAFAMFLRELAQDAPGAQLLIVGDGEERLAAQQAASALGLRDKVIFAGARQDVPGCMAAMDVYLQPSFYEGHSLTLLEAAASGLPVVSTAVGGTPEIVEDGRTGYLHPPDAYAAMASSLRWLQRNPQLRRTMGELGREKVVRRFSVETMVRGYEQLYRVLLGVPEQRCVA